MTDAHSPPPPVVVRTTRPDDFDSIIELCLEVYPESPPWTSELLASHLRVFPQGQLVAEDLASRRVVGMAASLIVWWDDYEFSSNWREFTSHGTFANHDPQNGRTLYGAEIMVSPQMRGRGVGKQIYAARRRLCESLKLLRIRAGARLRGYHRYADRMSHEEYVERVVRNELQDPTLTFQLRQGFEVVAVTDSYLRHDPESLGHAAVIEWLNPAVATPADYIKRNPRYLKPTR